ncbi:hypothetical protein BUZ14_13075 [Staphylococcus gallinarum]|jgi:hypothetical protein|uniref:Uncharacterized protein n=1 Tax=Staphylococcus gallinarum TaxID=1293 RepID=A0A2T4STN8_STAGA|nr:MULTISPECIES: hypothetical protein [Staphylococcus]MBF7023245.1 hypothetical protein [Staphylococcus kloosii]MCG7340328.1 hypothetical protein [Staphylococcus sp. ACRSN]PHS79823.1 hypothetical protein BTM19_12505 [Staphylococcus xylosus]PNZ17144.1 hypothetical protein CD106_00840 [Staphylococcus xylosus]PTL07607.1 hypothetical protein BUZ15_14100 [Staphylococcus gallinarum]
MSQKINEKEELDQINRQIEEELNEYDAEKDQQKVKKEFLTLKFFAMFIILSLMILSIVKLFV